jgi:hypothetical protein
VAENPNADAPTADADADTEAEPPLTAAVARAKSGLRRDVASLVDALDAAELLVPISKQPPNARDGEQTELDGELTLSPHLLPDASGEPFVALFTHTAPLDPIVQALEWTTDGEQLKVCSLPARLALEMAREVLRDTRVRGLVIDPGAPSELGLSRNELESLMSGRPIPLLAYVRDIPEDESERTLIAEEGDPLPEELVEALDAWLDTSDDVQGYRVDRTFNPDRDLEPHLTLTVLVTEDADRRALFQSVTGAIEGKVPPPGYLDVLFET